MDRRDALKTFLAGLLGGHAVTREAMKDDLPLKKVTGLDTNLNAVEVFDSGWSRMMTDVGHCYYRRVVRVDFPPGFVFGKETAPLVLPDLPAGSMLVQSHYRVNAGATRVEGVLVAAQVESLPPHFPVTTWETP